jgi:hypothetical protein
MLLSHITKSDNPDATAIATIADLTIGPHDILDDEPFIILLPYHSTEIIV